MTISELIKKLEDIKDQEGDLLIEVPVIGTEWYTNRVEVVSQYGVLFIEGEE